MPTKNAQLAILFRIMTSFVYVYGQLVFQAKPEDKIKYVEKVNPHRNVL